MNIAIIGANGKAGGAILQEALTRGHQVTAIVRDASKVKVQDSSVTVIEKDIFDLTREDLSKYDVVVNAFNAGHGQEHHHVTAGRVLIEGLRGVDGTRLIVVGGAGSLFVDDERTTRVFDTPDFPTPYLPTATNMGTNLEELKASTGVTWTYISPSAFFDAEGKRTGSYVQGKEQLLVNQKGDSYISYADYAIAVIDEIEQSQHVNERYTVVGEAE